MPPRGDGRVEHERFQSISLQSSETCSGLESPHGMVCLIEFTTLFLRYCLAGRSLSPRTEPTLFVSGRSSREVRFDAYIIVVVNLFLPFERRTEIDGSTLQQRNEAWNCPVEQVFRR